MSARVEPACPRCGSPAVTGMAVAMGRTFICGRWVQGGGRDRFEDGEFPTCDLIADLRGRLRAVEPVVEAAVRYVDAWERAWQPDAREVHPVQAQRRTQAHAQLTVAVDVYRRVVAPDRNAEADQCPHGLRPDLCPSGSKGECRADRIDPPKETTQ